MNCVRVRIKEKRRNQNVQEYLLGGLLAARFLKWMPLMISTERRPVVALYTRPTRISGVDDWLTDWKDEALSLHVMSDRLAWDSPPWKPAFTKVFRFERLCPP